MYEFVHTSTRILVLVLGCVFSFFFLANDLWQTMQTIPSSGDQIVHEKSTKIHAFPVVLDPMLWSLLPTRLVIVHIVRMNIQLIVHPNDVNDFPRSISSNIDPALFKIHKCIYPRDGRDVATTTPRRRQHRRRAAWSLLKMQLKLIN